MVPSVDVAGRRPLPSPPRRRPPINATAIHRDWLASTTPGAVAAFAASLGVSAPSLAAVGAAWAAPYAAWAFPMCDGYGNVVGIRLRKERGKFAVRGSRQGIFLCAGVSAQRTLFVCEGPTDTAAALDLGLFAAGRPNCCCGGLEMRTYARRHKCDRAVIIADNDKPGLDGARRWSGAAAALCHLCAPGQGSAGICPARGYPGHDRKHTEPDCLERMKKPSAYLPFYGNDFFEAIAGYSDAVGMGYLRAIWHYWSHTGCAGLPDDDEYLRRVCGCERTEWARTKAIIFDNRYLFRLENGPWHQPRCRKEWEKSKECSTSGRRPARPRR